MSKVNCEEMRRTKTTDEWDELERSSFFPRTRYWRPTERWERAWRRNLARAPRKHTSEESLAIKHAVWDWREQNPSSRCTGEELAASLGVSKQYVSHLAHTLPPRIALPPVGVRPRAIVHGEPVIEGHSWDCQCGSCSAIRHIQVAIRD